MAETQDKLVRPDDRKPFTDEERRARYELLRRKSMLSPRFAEHRNPDWVVRWVFIGAKGQDISNHKAMGFEFAKDDPKAPEDKRKINTVVELSEDGFYRMGDVILMQIPKMDYEFYLNENVQLSRRMVNNGKESFKEEAKRLKTASGKQVARTFTYDREDSSGGIQFHD